MKHSIAEVESAMAASKRQFLAENLKPGEAYAGLLLGENGEPDAHIFLLPGEMLDASWDKCMAWADKAGYSLPTRREQSLLIANLKSHFKPRYYWSCEQHAVYPTYAWIQIFGNGLQDGFLKSCAGAARLVRRLTIQ